MHIHSCFFFSGAISTFQLCAFVIDAAMNEIINGVEHIIKKLSAFEIDVAIGCQRSWCDSVAKNENNDDDNE